MKSSRRSFLKIAAAVAPTLWLPRRVRAAAGTTGTAKHLLLLHTKGGFRSHATFNAVGAYRHNPFGAQALAPLGTRNWALGAACGAERPTLSITGNHGHYLSVPEQDIAAGVQKTYSITGSSGHAHNVVVTAAMFTQLQAMQSVTITSDTGGGHTHDVTLGAVPSFHRVSHDVAVIGTVDHNPGGAHDPNHRTAIYRVATGQPEGVNGLLSLVGKLHPMYAGGFSMSAVPPVEIGPSEFGLGVGTYATTRPLSVQSAYGAFDADLPIGKGWKMQARAALDAQFRDTRSRNYRPRLSEFAASKTNAAAFADLLKDPKLDFVVDAGAPPEVAYDGFTNTQLREILGDYDMTSLGDTASMQSWGADVAMALRFFSFGSPMAVVTRDWYDMHDDESILYGPRTRDLVRQLAGLNHILKQMDHPAGGKYWDHTVVATVSEFSRNNTDPATGFNSGSGSDHVGQDSGPSRNQAIALMGGPIAPGILVGPTDDQINATGTSYRTTRLIATFLDLLGVDAASTPVSQETPITEVYV